MMLGAVRRAGPAFAASRPRLAGYGTPRDHEPAWLLKFNETQMRQGKDSLDWFFRLFNKTRVYETFLKSTPMYFGLMVVGGMVGGWGWGCACEAYWERCNRGKLYKDVPYVYPED